MLHSPADGLHRVVHLVSHLLPLQAQGFHHHHRSSAAVADAAVVEAAVESRQEAGTLEVTLTLRGRNPQVDRLVVVAAADLQVEAARRS